MNELVASILSLGSEQMATEDAACAALVAVRFPGGLACPCGASCTRNLAVVTCARGHSFTIFVDTPFATKRRPRARALFLAIRAFALSARSISAREIAREVGAPHATIWRHLLTLRALLQPPIAQPAHDVAAVQLCGRHTAAEPAWVRADARVAIARVDLARDVDGTASGKSGSAGRMLAESVRTMLNGTFHGVAARWLQAYLDEVLARWRIGVDVAAWLVQELVDIAHPLTFRVVRRHFRAEPRRLRTIRAKRAKNKHLS